MGFEELNLHGDVLKALEKKGFTEPTAIQKSCIPKIKEGRDVVGQSLTGSGKTAAFGLPIIEKIHPGKGVQALILTPTRELASQVKDTLITFSAFKRISITAVYGGVGMMPQIDALKRADIIVATPGRMLDHLRRNTVKLDKVSFLVIDEADKMFEMGFIEDVEKIIGYTPRERQTLLFSATISTGINHLIKIYLKEPCMIKEQIHVDKSLLKQVYYEIDKKEKFSLLVHFLKNKTSGLAIVFCATRREVDIISKNLKQQGINSMAVHGGLSQNKRTYAVDAIKQENIQVLVATDVAARGLDIKHISHIYNYDSPKNSSEYTHRIGRTARAGERGEAITFLTEKDHDNFRNVISDRSLVIQKQELPKFEMVRFSRETHGREDSPKRGEFHRRDNSSNRPKRFGSRDRNDRRSNSRFGHSRPRYNA